MDKRHTFYWIRTNVKDKDNVAIGESPLEKNYRVSFKPSEGHYDLLVSGATYDRDNGRFECRLKEQGTGNELHAQSINLTVLVPSDPPQINPVNPVAVEGQPTQLVCSAQGGSPDPVLRWYRKGEVNPLEGVTQAGGSRSVATLSTLTIQPQKEDDGAEYRCVAWNRAMDANDKKEATVSLTVNYAPRVTVSASPSSAEKGSRVEMVCQVDAKPAVYSVHWKKGNRFVATSFNHSLDKVSLDDDGTYVCSADNGLGQLGESQLQLDVLYEPIVTVETRREVEMGSSVAVPCNVSAKPSPAVIEWLKEGDDEFRVNGPVLRLNRVVATDTGRYTCRAVNTIGGIERSSNGTFQLLVRHEPGTAHITPEEPIAVDEASITLTCGANPPGWPAPQYRWWRAGAEATILAVSPEFTIPVARQNNEGTYYCQPSNVLGTGGSSSVKLRVFQAPRFISQLAPTKQMREGDSGLNVTCSAQGKPKPSITWLKDGVEIVPTSSNSYKLATEESENSNAIFTVRSTLIFDGAERPSMTQLTAADRGVYTCAFENQVRRIESSLTLKVEHAPIVLDAQPKVAFPSGSDAYVVCQMQAYPRPEFQWWFGDEAIQSLDKYEVNVTISNNDVYQSFLRIADINEADYGEYTCKSWNHRGENSARFQLQDTSAPEAPTNLRLVEAGFDTIVLEWEEGFNGGYLNTIYSVSYRSADNIQQEDDCQYQNPCSIRGLQQLQSYVFQVRAENSKGQSELSNVMSVSTTLDLSRIPDPKQVTYEPKSKTIAFHVDSPLSLIAFVESRISEQEDSDWMLTQKISVRQPISREVLDLVRDNTEEIRIKFCLEANTTLCSSPVVAVIGDLIQQPTKALTAIPTKYMVAIIVACVVGCLIFSLFSVFYCYRRRRAQKLKKLLEMEKAHSSSSRPTMTSQQAPPPYYAGLENKGRDQTLDTTVMDDAASKNALYATQNGYGYAVGNGHINNGGVNMAYTEQSYSNSNNGGSVNSQDSLWQLKANGDVMNQDRSYHYDPMTHGGYGGFEDYSHYPPPSDDYLNQRNQREQYVSNNADPYAAVHKVNKRMDHLDSTYHNVSGLPDPYMEAEPEDNSNKAPQAQQQQHIQLSFDESLESGYSTPNSRNRRVIREIIV